MEMTELRAAVAEETPELVTFELTVGYRTENRELDSQLPWLLDVTISGYGSREAGREGRVPLPIKTKLDALAGPPLDLRDQPVGETGTSQHVFRCALKRADFAVPDNDQYLVAARLVPDVQMKPSNRLTYTIRQDL